MTMSEGEGITFGGWLKQQRKTQGFSPDELAERIGCSSITLLKIEAGERRPSRQLALLLAEFFRIPDDERDAFVTFARYGQSQPPTAGATLASSGPDKVSARAPWRAAHLRQTNLPAPLTRLVGREHNETVLRDLLMQPRPRLLTLTGAPGIGKTRLALQVASTLVDYFEDGVFLVELAPVSDPDLVIPAIARALDVREMGGEAIDALLAKYLSNKRLLLLLDNFEQVLDAASGVVALLQASPWLKVLVTSREALHVRGEKQFPMLPLELPDPSRLPALGVLARNPCVDLLVEQASAINPDFTLTTANAEDIAAICVSLDGLPLALELAANAVAFSPSQAREALSHRLKILGEGARDLPPRQRTLRNAIEWSYELLDEGEGRLFRRLSVFVGGFALNAAEVVGNHDEGLPPFPVREGVASLAGKSLIREEGQSGQERFGMLETIRAYASEKLHESGEGEGLRRLHAYYFMQLAEEAEPHLRGAKQAEWLGRLEEEHENFRAALHWVREKSLNKGERISGDDRKAAEAAELALRIAGAIGRYWQIRGYLSEGREQLAAVLELSLPLVSLRPYRAKALNGAGALAYVQGDHDAADSLWKETLALHRGNGDKRGMANSLNNLGLLAHDRGDISSARSLYVESLAVMRELGDKVGIAHALNNLGVLVYDQGDNSLARRLWEESVAIKRELGDKIGIAASLNNLGSTAREQGDYAAARSFHEQSLSIRRELGDQVGIAQALERLGAVAYEEGDYASARTLHVESLTILWKTASTVHIPYGLLGLGRLATGAGEAHRGARILGAAAALWERMGVEPEPYVRREYEAGMASARARLGDEALEMALSEGRAMEIEQAIAYALGESS